MTDEMRGRFERVEVRPIVNVPHPIAGCPGFVMPAAGGLVVCDCWRVTFDPWRGFEVSGGRKHHPSGDELDAFVAACQAEWDRQGGQL